LTSPRARSTSGSSRSRSQFPIVSYVAAQRS
jgi:hypothetical protein